MPFVAQTVRLLDQSEPSSLMHINCHHIIEEYKLQKVPMNSNIILNDEHSHEANHLCTLLLCGGYLVI